MGPTGIGSGVCFNGHFAINYELCLGSTALAEKKAPAIDSQGIVLT